MLDGANVLLIGDESGEKSNAAKKTNLCAIIKKCKETNKGKICSIFKIKKFSLIDILPYVLKPDHSNTYFRKNYIKSGSKYENKMLHFI